MIAPLFVRALTPAEHRQLEAGLRSPDAFTLRRCQIVLASAKGQRPAQIAANLGCAVQTVRNTLRAFEAQGIECLTRQSSRPQSVQPVLDEAKRTQLQELLQQSPRVFGKPHSTWTLGLLAQVCHEQGLSERPLSGPTMRVALLRLGANWKRAKNWINSPDLAYARKKSVETA